METLLKNSAERIVKLKLQSAGDGTDAEIPVSVDAEQRRIQATVEYISLKQRDNSVIKVVL